MKIGRNDSCPCNSGLKYKKCCSNSTYEQVESAQKSGLELEYYYNHLESQFDSESAATAFMIMKVLKLDGDHGDQKITSAVRYFLDKNLQPEDDAPTDFLTTGEVAALNRNGTFRPKLYAMLLASKVSEGISNKTLFIQNSDRFGWSTDRG